MFLTIFFRNFLLEFQLKNLNLIDNEIKSILTKMCSSKVLLILILFNVPKKENNFQFVFFPRRNWIGWFIDFDFIPNKPKIRWITFNFDIYFNVLFCIDFNFEYSDCHEWPKKNTTILWWFWFQSEKWKIEIVNKTFLVWLSKL